MEFRTRLPLPEAPFPINYQSGILLLGSCFSVHMQDKLDHFRFNSFGNPFGILYNPVALEQVISKSLNGYEYTPDDLFELDGLWHCFDTHSDLSHSDQDTALEQMNKAVSTTQTALHNASHVILTLGSAWAYRHIASDNIVGNCHKVSQRKFLKELLSVKRIIAALENAITLIKDVNPKVNVVLSLSPVRHLKDGFEGNAQSKAHLRTAIGALTDPRHRIFYFPAYEIVNDELRDYRFYADDMIHPNSTAIDYIWGRFKACWIHRESHPVMTLVDKVQKDRAHRPFNPDSEQYRKFREKLEQRLHALEKEQGITF
jgi:hypothetical protein